MSVAPFSIQRHDGRSIRYSGIAFEGSPEQVFWGGYIEPFLEDLCSSAIDEARMLARDRSADLRLLMPDVLALLEDAIRGVYAEMARIHIELYKMGGRRPGVPPDVGPKIDHQMSFARERANSELSLYHAPPILELWFRRNQFIAWLIPLLVSLLALAVSWYALSEKNDASPSAAPVPTIRAAP